MSESEAKRPSFQQSQRILIVGALVGLLFGCGIGAGIVRYYMAGLVYQGGAYPKELTVLYQEHYLAMVIDSYIMNRQFEWAQERLKSFDVATKIKALASQSAAYSASGRTVEAQLTNELALALKNKEKWDINTIKKVVVELTDEYQKKGIPLKVEAVGAFSNLLIEVVPVPATVAPGKEVITSTTGVTVTPTVPVAKPSTSWFSWQVICCFGFIILVLVLGALWYIRRQTAAQMSKKKEIVYEGEGEPPITQWQSSYYIERDQYNEDFEIQNKDGAFLGNIGIEKDQDTAPSPKKVMDFVMWVFDANDIKTYNRFVMSQQAYDDEDLRSELAAEPLSEAVLAQPGGSFIIETTALRVEVKVDEMEYIEGGNAYFNKFAVTANIFLREGVQLKVGEMDVPDHMMK